MNKIKDISKKFVEAVKRKGIPVSSAYLFGSYAKGNAKSYSDIDICIVSPKLGRNHFGEMFKLREISTYVDSRIEPFAFGPKDLDDKYSSLASEIKKYGISLI